MSNMAVNDKASIAWIIFVIFVIFTVIIIIRAPLPFQATALVLLFYIIFVKRGVTF